ncbi:MAG: DsrE/DsrF/DrsH-like family protein [Candidatus Bathyarchaeota archaeon]
MSEKRIVYIQTSGVDTPERTYAPFILAITAVAMGIDATIYFMMKGCTIIKHGEAEKIKLRGMPPLKNVMNKAIKSGVKLKICEQSCMLLGLKKEDFIEPTKIVGAATLNDQILDADAVLSF